MEDKRLLTLCRNGTKIHILIYGESTYTDQYLQYSSYHQTSFKESAVFSLFNRTYSIIALTKRVKREWILRKHYTSQRYPRGRVKNEYKFTTR